MTLPPASKEQQSVLDLGLTSIRVRAGAGTGKTTTMAMVIANLVANHHVMPEQILGITFTNKAAAELADNVRQSLADDIDPGRQVEVHTYHGFAAQLLAEFGVLAGFDNRSRVITPTFSRQLLAETSHHRSYAQLDMTWQGTLDRVKRLADRLGDHLVDPADVITLGLEHEDDDVWKARVEMAETLVAYDADKRRLGVVDYSDLVTGSMRVMKAHPHLAAAVKDRYRVVVLDEYQDTNPAQRMLLTTIFNDGFPVIAVGDEDQTIYEWRGASAENFDLFPTHFPTSRGTPAHERGLRLNRRSAPEILTLANEVRQRANPGAEPLEAMEGQPAGEVMTYWAQDAIQEADWIAARFEELHSEGEPWKNMAVLFRKNKDFAVVIESMARHDIPVEVANVGGLLSVPEVAELRAWLTILEHPEDSTALTHVLFGSRFRLGMADIAPLSRRAGSDSATRSDDAENPTPVTLLEAIESADQIPDLRPGAVEALRRFYEIYREVLTESQGLSLVETIRLILDRTMAWQDIEALPPNPRLTARLNVYRLLDLAEDWSPLRGRPSLGAFLDYLTLMEQEPAEELDSAHLSGEDAVTLVTVHRAKGLEWDTVAVPALTKGGFPSGSGQFPDPVRFAESLPSELRVDNVMDGLPDDDGPRKDFFRDRHYDQEWRVAYVALTRAKRRLLLSGAYWYGLPEPTQNAKQPSELFDIAESNDVSRSLGHSEPGQRPVLLRAPKEQDDPDPLFDNGWASALREASDGDSLTTLAVDREVMDEYEQAVEQTRQRLFDLAQPTPHEDSDDPGSSSVTGLVTYAQCPKRFYWTDVDPLPRRRAPAAVYGTQVHRRIELHQRGQVPFEEMTEDLYDIVAGESGEGGPGGFNAYLDSRFATEKASLIEVPFAFEMDGGFRVRGRIDAVYRDGPNWEVVDFKSGRPSTDPSRQVQLQAYAIAARDVDFGLPMPEGLDVTFAYLGRGLNVETIHADESWVDHAREDLNAMATQIAQGQFAESPGGWCGNCDFLQFCGPGQRELAK